MQKCSYPKCGHVAEIVTNHHCRTSHDMSKKEVIETHGNFKDYFIITKSLDKDGLEHSKY